MISKSIFRSKCIIFFADSSIAGAWGKSVKSSTELREPLFCCVRRQTGGRLSNCPKWLKLKCVKQLRTLVLHFHLLTLLPYLTFASWVSEYWPPVTSPDNSKFYMIPLEDTWCSWNLKICIVNVNLSCCSCFHSWAWGDEDTFRQAVTVECIWGKELQKFKMNTEQNF